LDKKVIPWLVLVVLGLMTAVWFLARYTGPSPETQNTAVYKNSLPPSMPSAKPNVPASAADTQNAPWFKQGDSAALPGMVGKSTGVLTPKNAAEEQRLRSLQDLEKMKHDIAEAIKDPKHPDVKKIAGVLTELKQKYGNTIGGVDFDAVLTNLEKSQEIQVVVQQMQTEVAKQNSADPKKLAAYGDQLKKLQAQLQTNVMATQNASNTNLSKSK
jgi:hypothetical protein